MWASFLKEEVWFDELGLPELSSAHASPHRAPRKQMRLHPAITTGQKKPVIVAEGDYFSYEGRTTYLWSLPWSFLIQCRL